MAHPFGVARTAAAAETATASGIYLGHYADQATGQVGAAVHYAGDRHVVLFSPTGGGKTKRIAIPNLLLGLEDRSVIVIDPKGELAAVTAEHRRSLGHEVLILNPFNVLGLGSGGFNPLSSLDRNSPEFYDDAAALGEALIRIEGKDPHWPESAQGLMVALVMWEAMRFGPRANLENIRGMLTEADEWVKAVGKDGEPYMRQTKGLAVIAKHMVAAGGYEIASLAGRFTGQRDELASIQSTADTQTRWLLSQPVRADLKKAGIDFRRLKERPMTVYVVLPAERLRTHSTWLRLVIVSALRALYRPGGVRTVMLIDEMAALGHLPPLEDALGLVRGYGVQIFGILQDLTQLKALYNERWETFIANAGAVMGFAPNDSTTAKWMSDRAGQTTVVAKGFSETSNTSTGGRQSESSGTGASDNQVGRPLFLPHELFGLQPGEALAWLANLSPTIPLFAPLYMRIAKCRERAGFNPYAVRDDDAVRDQPRSDGSNASTAA